MIFFSLQYIGDAMIKNNKIVNTDRTGSLFRKKDRCYIVVIIRSNKYIKFVQRPESRPFIVSILRQSCNNICLIVCHLLFLGYYLVPNFSSSSNFVILEIWFSCQIKSNIMVCCTLYYNFVCKCSTWEPLVSIYISVSKPKKKEDNMWHNFA